MIQKYLQKLSSPHCSAVGSNCIARNLRYYNALKHLKMTLSTSITFLLSFVRERIFTMPPKSGLVKFAPEKSKVRLIFAADVERPTTQNTIFPYDGGTCD